MPDIFLSYARRDELEHGRVRPIAEGLQAIGFDVFWDANIPAGHDYIDYLERQLADAKCVVVSWTKTSTRSFWVREEAAAGRDRGILVPIALDQAVPPLGFKSIQTINLQDWDGSPESEEWKRLVFSIKQILPNRLKTGATRVTSMSPWHLVLVLDDSGSMSNQTASMINDSIGYMLAEMSISTYFSKKPYFFVSIITYGSNIRILLEKTSVNQIELDQAIVTGGSGSCNIADALRVARNLLKRNDAKATDFIPYVFLLAGGQPDDAITALRAATALKELALPCGSPKLVAISVGSDTDRDFMRSMASSTDLHLILTSPEKIVRFFPAVGTTAAIQPEILDEALMKL